MTIRARRDSNGRLIGPLMLTIAIVGGSIVAVLLGAGSLGAIAAADRVGAAGADLSSYITARHERIRGHVSDLGTLDADAMVSFDIGVERRVAQVRKLKALLEEHTTAAFWTAPLRATVEIPGVDAERRAYLSAATATVATPADEQAASLRLFDLRALKLIQTVEAVRDTAGAVRARALLAIDAIVVVSSGFGAMLMAYLIWMPVLTAQRMSGRGPLERSAA
jgi:hypothetical protein